MMEQYFENVVVNRSQILPKFYFFILAFIAFFITTTTNAQIPPPLGYYDTVSACQGSTVTLLGPASLHPGDFPNMIPIGWHGPNGFTSTAADIALPNTNTVGTSSYYFEFTQDEVFHSLEYSVTIIAGPNVTISGNATISCGGSTTLTASGGYAYVWNTGSPPIVPSTPVVAVPNPSLALGLHKLVPSYNGPGVRLKRASDGAQMDFGFVGNELDKNAIHSWLSVAPTNQALCVRLYDQSGHGGDVAYNGEDFNAPILSFNAIGRPVLHFNTNQTL
jgi:hypothetical protein